MARNSKTMYAENKLKHYGEFIEKHNDQMNSLLQNNVISWVDISNQTNVIVIDSSVKSENLLLPQFDACSRPITKVLLTFASLCIEINDLTRASQKFHLKLLLLDKDIGNVLSKPNCSKELALLKMSGIVDCFCEVQFLMRRAVTLVHNILLQCGLYLDTPYMDINLYTIFDSLSIVLEQILIFNELLNNSTYYQNWIAYRKTAESLIHQTQFLEFYSQSELNGLLNALKDIELLLSGVVFQKFLDDIQLLRDQISSKALAKYTEYANEYITRYWSKLEEIDKLNFHDVDKSDYVVRLNIFCLIIYKLCGRINAKNVKNLFDINGRHLNIMLASNIYWSPMELLIKYAPSLVTSTQRGVTTNSFNRADKNRLQQSSQFYCSKIALWALQVQRMLSVDTFEIRIEQFKKIFHLLLLGQRYNEYINMTIKKMVSTHINLNLRMAPATISSICKYIELEQLMYNILRTNSVKLTKITNCLIQYLQYKVLHQLAISRKKILSLKLKKHKTSLLSNIKLIEKCFIGPPTVERLLLANIALDASIFSNELVSLKQQKQLKSILARIDALLNFLHRMEKFNNMHYLKIYQSLSSIFFKSLVKHGNAMHSFKNSLTISNDLNKISNCIKSDGSMILTEGLFCNVHNFYDSILNEICGEVEIFLRFEALSNLIISQKPFKNISYEYRNYAIMCPTEFNRKYAILKDYIENHFSLTFYNFTTIAMHDRKSYEKMRHIAIKRLRLEPIDDYLPTKIADQTSDLLQIMRNIHIFVTGYVYNMTLQIFMEKQSLNKHVRTIGISHVANSMRTHGTGIINTTINFIYQFLRQKFYTFSTFLYDEQIRSRLIKELRTVALHKEGGTSILYSYQQAEIFNKGIKKLGLSNEGETFMDLFRRLITHIGNAIGYIRLVQSASKNANFSSSIYLPNFNDNLGWLDVDKLDNVAQDAANNLKTNIGISAWNFYDNTSYFQLLLKAFKPFFDNRNNYHIKNFFLIVPPLILNYMEHMLSHKSKINIKSRQGVIIFDDGFPVGLSYILKLLNQCDEFNELRWHYAVREYLANEKQKIQTTLATVAASNKAVETSDNLNGAKYDDEKLLQTLALIERRISSYEVEYSLFQYNLRIADIIFQ